MRPTQHQFAFARSTVWCTSRRFPIKIVTESVSSTLTKISSQLTHRNPVEYTPQAFVQSDLDIFFGNFSGDSGFRPGATPKVVGIDGGFVQTTDKGFDYNGESNLDLQYGMEMVSSKQPVTLYQVGDAQEGENGSYLPSVAESF